MRTAPMRTAFLPAIALGIALCGCAEDPVTRPQPPYAGPVASTPGQAVRRLEWQWNQKAPFDEITTDFQFVFAGYDSAGSPVTIAPLDRDGLMCAALRLYTGTTAGPCSCGPVPMARADTVALAFDPTFVVQPDSRPGKDPRWHKEILSGVNGHLVLQDGTRILLGGASLFRLVRGDSAAVPPTMGVPADSLHWFIETWSDEALRKTGRTSVTPTMSWGELLSIYACH